MKKFITLIAAVAMIATASAKVVELKMADGTKHIFTTSQLGSITFNDDNTVTATTFDGKAIEGLTGEVEKVQIDDEEDIIDIVDQELAFTYQDIKAFARNAKRINFVYPSVDPQGNPITLSGAITIPEEIFNGEQASEGIMLFNHFTIANKEEAPTRGYLYLEQMFLCNPFKPNYIVIESDFYGFGVTERFPQAYLYGTTNAQATLDCLEPAKRILEQLGIDTGKYLFNLGYSSGGFDAMATLKLADQTNPGEVLFDKTFAGGGPYDLRTVYEDYVNTDSITYLVSVPLLIVSFNETGQLGLDYNEVFKPLIADMVDEYILSKNYSTWPINYAIGTEHTVSDMLQPDYLDFENEHTKELLAILDEKSIMTDWEPNPANNIYLFHSRDDDYVTFECARKMADFLTDHGFQKSIIPGKTNLQTNLVVHQMGHLLATLVYVAQSVASIDTWSLLHDDTSVADIIDDLMFINTDPVDIILALRDRGIDIKQIFNGLFDEDGESGLNIEDIIAALMEAGIDVNTIIEELSDSGIDIEGIIAAIMADDDHAEQLAARKAARAQSEPLNVEQLLAKAMTDWYTTVGIK